MLRKTLVTLPQSFALLDFITVLKNSLIWPKTDTFCIKWYFLPKRNNAIKIWHFSKTENTSLRKLNISTRNEHFWKEWPFARKMKISFNIGVSARFSLLPVKHIMQQVTQNLLSFYSKLTTKLTPFLKKFLDFSKEFMPHEM